METRRSHLFSPVCYIPLFSLECGSLWNEETFSTLLTSLEWKCLGECLAQSRCSTNKYLLNEFDFHFRRLKRSVNYLPLIHSEVASAFLLAHGSSATGQQQVLDGLWDGGVRVGVAPGSRTPEKGSRDSDGPAVGVLGWYPHRILLVSASLRPFSGEQAPPLPDASTGYLPAGRREGSVTVFRPPRLPARAALGFAVMRTERLVCFCSAESRPSLG